MSLSEDQILRYSRHILLTAVGGRGQERLMSRGARLIGGGGALATAAAYLAAGGTAVWADTSPVQEEDVGFLYDAQDVGHAQDARLEAALRDLNPDALAPRSAGWMAQGAATFSGPGPWLLIGAADGSAGIVYRSERGCEECFRLNALGLADRSAGARDVLVGAVAALAYQRLCLGLSPDLGGLWIADGGEITSMEMRACARCR
jgi:adenylyltransferase/sulfurtransferase